MAQRREFFRSKGVTLTCCHRSAGAELERASSAAASRARKPLSSHSGRAPPEALAVLLLPERGHKKLKPLESRVRVLIDVEVYHHPLIVAPWGGEIHVELQLGRRVTDGERRDVWPGSHSVALRIGHRAAAGGRGGGVRERGAGHSRPGERREGEESRSAHGRSTETGRRPNHGLSSLNPRPGSEPGAG